MNYSNHGMFVTYDIDKVINVIRNIPENLTRSFGNENLIYKLIRDVLDSFGICSYPQYMFNMISVNSPLNESHWYYDTLDTIRPLIWDIIKVPDIAVGSDSYFTITGTRLYACYIIRMPSQ